MGDWILDSRPLKGGPYEGPDDRRRVSDLLHGYLELSPEQGARFGVRLEPGSAIESAARAALSRMLRNDSLPSELRLALADLIDPKGKSEATVAFSLRKLGRRNGSTKGSILFWELLKAVYNDEPLSRAVDRIAEERNVSVKTVWREWANAKNSILEICALKLTDKK